ncbi:hypothetical protein [Proteiniclasticum ruminis]|uniref:hypothetical protein n=1 Tax=Proteiniclasticum ruminis TaxID=398199 RepID=UPI00289E9AB0|nr:hypothetical protein [Proteiniclasticum ruminis]
MLEYGTISRTSSAIKLLEKSIKRLVDDCSLWGDLPYTKEDYDKVHELLLAYVKEEEGDREFYNMFRRYPYCFITDIIRFVLYDYDGSAVWAPWFEEFGVDNTGPIQSKIGSFIKYIFEVQKLEIVEDGGLKYITPILYQAGMPNFSVRKMYDALYYTIGSPYFSEEEFCDEVRTRTSIFDMTSVRYFKNTQMALEFINEIRNIIEAADEYDALEEYPADHDFNPRYLEEFFHWKKIRKTQGKGVDSKNLYYISPKLVFDELKGVCIKLPPQNISDESIDVVLWKIECEDTEDIMEIMSPVYMENRVYKIEEHILPVPPSSSYTVTMYNADNTASEVYRPWTISGLHDEVPSLIFSGDAKSTQQLYFTQKGNIFLHHKDVVFDRKESLTIHQQLDLPLKWKDYRAEFVMPQEELLKVQLRYDGEFRQVDVKRMIDVSLVQLSTLFDEDYEDVGVPVYVSLPMIEVAEKRTSLESMHYKTWKLTIRNRTTNHKEEFPLEECIPKYYEDVTRFSFPKNIQKSLENRYGEYELRLQMGRSLSVLHFYYVPEIIYQGELIHDVKNPYLNSLSLKIREKEGVRFEFEREFRVETTDIRGQRWLRIEGIRAKAFIRGKMIVQLPSNQKSIQVPFRKRTGKIEWKFWNETDNAETSYGKHYFEDTEVFNGNWMCYLSLYGDEEYVRVTLESGQGEIHQEKRIYKDPKGSMKIQVNGFYDTMRMEKLPQRIMCYIGENDLPLCLAVIRKVAVLKNLAYRKKGEYFYLIWENQAEVQGKTIKLISVSNPGAEDLILEADDIISLKFPNKQNPNKPIIKYGIKSTKIPESGLYMVEVEEEEDDFFFEEEEKVIVVDPDKFLHVKANEELKLESFTTIGQWVEVYLTNLGDPITTEKVHDKFMYSIRSKEYIFQESDVEVFYRLVSIVQNSKYLDKDTSSILQEFFTEVNVRFIEPEDRALLLKRVLQGQISKEEFIKMEYSLQLFLVKKNDEALLSREEVRKLWQLDEKLAILVSLRGGTERTGADTQKILLHLNAPMIQKTIQFKPGGNCRTSSWMDCFEHVVTGKCSCPHSGFPATEKFWGNIEDFGDAIVTFKNEVQLKKLSEMITDGYDFLGTNYLALCHHWLNDKYYKEKEHWKLAMNFSQPVRDLSRKVMKSEEVILKVLQKRTDGGTGSPHHFFYSVGVGAMLEASGKKDTPVKSDLRKIHRFWDHAFRAFPKLVMRDLIISELYMKFN